MSNREAAGRFGAGGIIEPLKPVTLRVLRKFAHTLRLRSPVFILAPPRSGSTMLFDSLAHTGRFHYYPVENDWVWWRVFPPERLAEPSDAVTADDVAGLEHKLPRALRNQILGGYRSRFDGVKRLERLASLMLCPGRALLDKTIANCFHLDALNRMFPDARYVFLVRDPRSNISSMIAGWSQPERFGKSFLRPALERLPDRTTEHWCYPVPPGWREVAHRGIAEICAWSWARHVETVLDFFRRKGIEPMEVRYERLIERPADVLTSVADRLGVPVSEKTRRRWGNMPLSRTTVSRPDGDKWRRLHGDVIRSLIPGIMDTARRIGYDLADGS